MKIYFVWKPLILNGVFIYMISTSYFLGKDAHQVNGFVQDFIILFFNSTLKRMNVEINF